MTAEEPQAQNDGVVRVEYEGEVFELDPEDMTLGEGNEVETLLGITEDVGGFGIALMVIYTSKRRAQPKRKAADVAAEVKAIKLTKVTLLKDEPDEEPGADPPTEGATGQVVPLAAATSGSETTPDEPGASITARSSA